MLFAYIAVIVVAFCAGAYFAWTFWPNGQARSWESAMELGGHYRIWMMMPEHANCYELSIQDHTGSGPRILIFLLKDDFARIKPGDIIERGWEEERSVLYSVTDKRVGSRFDKRV